MQVLDNVYRIPGLGNPADGLANTQNDIVPLLRLLESGVRNPGILRPFKSIASNGKLFAFFPWGRFSLVYSGRLLGARKPNSPCSCSFWLALGTHNFHFVTLSLANGLAGSVSSDCAAAQIFEG